MRLTSEKINVERVFAEVNENIETECSLPPIDVIDEDIVDEVVQRPKALPAKANKNKTRILQITFGQFDKFKSW